MGETTAVETTTTEASPPVPKDGDTDDEGSSFELAKEREQLAALSERVHTFLEKLTPWKSIMPSSLRRDLGTLQRVAREHSKEKKITWDYEVKRLTMETWRSTSPKVIGTPPPVIQTYYRTLGPVGAALNDPSHRSVDQKNLQRIKIGSQILHNELEIITSTAMSTPIVITPPYKLLVEFLLQIKTRLDEARHEVAQLPPPAKAMEPISTPTSSEADTPNTERSTIEAGPKDTDVEKAKDKQPEKVAKPEPQKSKEEIRRDGLETRVAHLECLVDFVEDTLGDIVEMRARIADGSLESIAFDDLWHLFKPGDLVITQLQGRAQLYKIYFVTGGQIRRRPLAQFEENRVGWRENAGVGTWSPLTLNAYKMAFDGVWVGPEDEKMQVNHFAGRKRIVDLPVFPLRFHPNADALLRQLEARGRKYMDSIGHKYYEGLTIPLMRKGGDSVVVDRSLSPSRISYRPPLRTKPYGSTGDDYRRGRKMIHHSEDLVSDVYIDLSTYFQTFHESQPQLGWLSNSKQDPTETSEMMFHEPENVVFYDAEVDNILAESFRAHSGVSFQAFRYEHEREMMTPEVYAMLPHYIPAYAFRYRQWYLLDVDVIREIDINRNSGFDDLVIPDDYKQLLAALVDNHTSGTQSLHDKLQKRTNEAGGAQIDLVPGKGQGLIILLHGPPGSGKTSTAETIAAYTQRPLYSITCGDIGVHVGEVEMLLDVHTSRAAKWGCVLLLDEADVFLMQRTWKEVERNALVSVFLRQLEYYSGILFLTTNRPGTIDEAFKSRIHVSLRYPNIDLQSTKLMWENIMRRLEAENEWADVKIEFDRKKLLAFAEQHFKRRMQSESTWNGRQVRNAFRAVLAMGFADRQAKLKEAGKTEEWAAASGKKKWMKVELTVKNFRKIAKTTREFEGYIDALRGRDSELARELEVRDDEYDPDIAPMPARKNYGAMTSRVVAGWGGRAEGSGAGLEGGRKMQAKKREDSRVLESEEDDDDDDADDTESDDAKDEDDD